MDHNHQGNSMINGSCHCGNVTLSIPALTETGTSCNCSICLRYGAIWGYFTEAEVNVIVGVKGISSYCHGDKMINFNRCNECGCMTHYTSAEQPGLNARLAVNYRMFGNDAVKKLTVRYFDGADTWKFIE